MSRLNQRESAAVAIEKPERVSAVTPARDFQSTLFERGGWWALRSLETLPQYAGVPLEDVAKLVVKELVDNALDASGDAEVRRLKDGTIEIGNAGAGMPGTDEEIACRFSISRGQSSSKYWRLPTRGAMGNGTRVVAGAILAASGGSLRVATCGRELTLAPQPDGPTSIVSRRPYGGDGTRIRVRLGERLEDDDALAWAQAAIEITRAAKLHGTPYAGASSPHWFTDDAFYDLLQSAGAAHVRQLVASLAGCSGAKAGEIAVAYLNRQAATLTKTEATALLESARLHSRAVRPERLGRVGAGYRSDDVYRSALGTFRMQGTDVDASIPYRIEVWAAAVDAEDEVSARLFVNRTPVTTPLECRVTGGINRELDYVGCGLNRWLKLGRKLVRFTVHVEAPCLPLTSIGKAPDLGRIEDEIGECVEKAVEAAKRGASGSRDEPLNRRIIAAIPTGQAELREGEREFGQRNLFYFVRDHIGEPSLDWDYFTKVVTDCEHEHGEVEGMWRDDRGVFVEPHTWRTTTLGTRSVASYARPEWNFRRVLYVEKQLHLEWLREDGFAERWDCALMCSKGYSTRAARDLIDFLAQSDEPVDVYAIHDFDAYGTVIFDTLQNETKARRARTIEIVDLGLHREDVEAMGLDVEDVDEPKKRRPTGSHISEDDAAWLQTHRVELDAILPASRFIAYVDERMAEYVDDEDRKVIPPVECIEAEQSDVRRRRAHARTLELLREQIEKLDADYTAELETIDETHNEPLDERLRDALGTDVSQDWREAVATITADFPKDGAP